jgi:hypothetical protein
MSAPFTVLPEPLGNVVTLRRVRRKVRTLRATTTPRGGGMTAPRDACVALQRESVLVVVLAMDCVAVAVVHVVDVVTVRDGHVTTSLAMRVAVVGVLKVCRSHGQLPFPWPGLYATRMS